MTENIAPLFEDDLVCPDRYTFEVGIKSGHRLGQAYFNSLSAEERDILRNTKYDPYYKNDEKSISRAHSYLRAQLSKV